MGLIHDQNLEAVPVSINELVEVLEEVLVRVEPLPATFRRVSVKDLEPVA